jgi:hypothetical protein
LDPGASVCGGDIPHGLGLRHVLPGHARPLQAGRKRVQNKLLYLKYVNLLQEMRTHALFLPVCQTNTTGPTNFIAYIDGEMARANDIAVAFDPTKFPTFKNIAADAK